MARRSLKKDVIQVCICEYGHAVLFFAQRILVRRSIAYRAGKAMRGRQHRIWPEPLQSMEILFRQKCTKNGNFFKKESSNGRELFLARSFAQILGRLLASQEIFSKLAYFQPLGQCES